MNDIRPSQRLPRLILVAKWLHDQCYVTSKGQGRDRKKVILFSSTLTHSQCDADKLTITK